MGITKKINFNANVKQLTDSDVTVGQGSNTVAGSSGINYILNPDAETSTTGWATYVNTAQAQPVNGTGGSANVTFTRTATAPLRGTGSFLLTKDAANRQGQGASYDFTIDAADKAKLLSLQFDYIVASGAFAAGGPGTDSDVEMWIYDKTNAQLIPVTPFKLVSNSLVTPGTFKGTFQTNSNSVSYRLILHVATTSASAWALEMDNFQVGPQSILNAPSLGDWNNSLVFTPSAGFGSGVATSNIYSRRVGDTLEVKGYITAGTVAASLAYFTLPFPIDTTKITGVTDIQRLGTWTQTTIGSSAIPNANVIGDLFFDAANPGNLYFAATVGGNTYQFINVNAFMATNVSITFSFSYPVQGWSSNTVTGQDADARVVSAYAYIASSQAVGANNGIPFDTVGYDTHGAYNPATGIYTVPVSGIYDVYTNLTASSAANVVLFKNGAFWNQAVFAASAGQPTSGVIPVECVAGDILQVVTVQARTFTSSGGLFLSFASFTKRSGPALPLASESVAATYYESGSTAYVNGVPVNYDGKILDTHGAVTTGSSWNFKVPISGNYQIGLVLFSSIGVTSAIVYKNGSAVTYLTSVPVTSKISGSSVTLPFLAGDLVDIRLDTSTTLDGPSSGTPLNVVSITRVGR